MPQLDKMRSTRRFLVCYGQHMNFTFPNNHLYRKLGALYKLLYQYRMIPTFIQSLIISSDEIILIHITRDLCNTS